MTDAETIAAGGQPYWKHTFDHPDHGKLTFTVERLPTTQDWLNHSVAQERIAPGLSTAGIAGATAAAVAAMHTFMQRPVLSETRIEDPDDPTHEKIEKTFYEPLEDPHVEFVTLVWATFFNWRAELLSDDTKEQVKNSSGATDGPDSADSSPATTTSPQPTHALSR